MRYEWIRRRQRQRKIAGLLYSRHAFDLSDEEVIWQWLENPYWQVFAGETYLQTKPPIDPSSLTRRRKRLGEAGVEELLAETTEAAKRANVIKTSSLKRMIVDTAVMEKAIAYFPRFARTRQGETHPPLKTRSLSVRLPVRSSPG